MRTAARVKREERRRVPAAAAAGGGEAVAARLVGWWGLGGGGAKRRRARDCWGERGKKWRVVSRVPMRGVLEGWLTGYPDLLALEHPAQIRMGRHDEVDLDFEAHRRLPCRPSHSQLSFAVVCFLPSTTYA